MDFKFTPEQEVFRWEYNIYLYLKRAKANEVALGDPVYHCEQVAQFLAGRLTIGTGFSYENAVEEEF